MNINYHFDQPPAVVVGLCGHGLSLIQALNEGQIPVIALETNLELPGVHTKLATLVRVSDINGIGPVSYTHLDVYKRQCQERGELPGKRRG